MKSILVVFPSSMQIGGIEKSLIGLLDALVALKDYEVDAFIYGHHGDLFTYINTEVNLLPEIKELAYLQQSIRTKICKGCYYAAWQRLRCQFEKKDFFELADRVRQRKAPFLSKEYDLAISFFLPFDFIANNVRAKKKLGWIHTDYSNSHPDVEALRKQYQNVDIIAGVSDDVCRTFCSVFPEFRSKVITVENIIPKEMILRQSEESVFDFDTDGSIRLLSVGRFCEAKNFDNIPEICKMIRSTGLDVKWYLIGFGDYEALIRQKIKVFEMEDYVIILGKKTNPYPYIAGCDLYVQPSRFEGKAVTVSEAQILGKPIVITNYPTAQSQLQNGYDGVIVPMDNQGCADGISNILKNKNLLSEISKNCLLRDYSNKNEIKKIMALCDN